MEHSWILSDLYDEMKWNEWGFRPPLCTYRLNWARRTSWGWWDDWDDTVLQTQDSKFEPWRSEAEHATSRSRRLPTILIFTRGWGINSFVSFKPPLYDEHCVHKFPCIGSGWAGVHLNTIDQSRIYLTARAWFMNPWLPLGRRWRNRRQRPLVLNMCKCHAKAQWVTVTLTDNTV